MNHPFTNQLPQGYYFITNTQLAPSEIIALRESVGWQGDSTTRWIKVLKNSLRVVGVRNNEDVLVGMACLTGNVRHAIMCDLAVHPNHQLKGVGAALMGALYSAVNEFGVMYVYAELAETNPFRDLMLASGFKQTGNSLFWKVYN